MRKISFHFYSNKRWLSTIIRWKTNGVYSHVGVEVNGRFYHSLLGKGVISEVKQYPDLKKTITFEVSDDEVVKAEAILEKLLGEPYDSLSLLAFMLNINVHDSGKYFCTEITRSVLESIAPDIPKRAKLISPEAFHDHLAYYQAGRNSLK